MWWCRSELEIGHAGIEHGYAPFVIQDSYDCILPFRHEGRLYYKCGVERAPGKFFCLVNDENGHQNMHPCKPDQEIQWNRGVLTFNNCFVLTLNSFTVFNKLTVTWFILPEGSFVSLCSPLDLMAYLISVSHVSHVSSSFKCLKSCKSQNCLR